MQALVRYIFTAIFVPIFTAVAARFIWEQPQETANVILKFLLHLGEQTWVHLTALSLGCFVAGLWVDWLLRRLDDTRAYKRKALGAEMVQLGNQLQQLKFPMQKESARIRSSFTTASKLGIWTPGQRIFQIPADDAYAMVRDYLMNVGQMLSDGNFREAKQYAKNIKANFNKAYPQHRLTSHQSLRRPIP